ncbi:Gfo/Idh/MocA family protein [Pedobacter panaciterrae]|uniref:Gfo/Idh/MocA family protein n=1 Tax=Pedobacter panaciterrae TaxID=363849 RepID=UPI0025930752|nr:Gfo/Idh/MocA family oxidoreductase [uncultured Pedobacter sp.]
MKQKIRVGIIGVSPDRGWASIAHIPALKALEDYEIKGISNRNQEKAQQAASMFNIPLIFQDNLALINSPEIDLVVITVKVPEHAHLVKAAIAAGKNIYCEWPLGNGLEETIALSDLAAKNNVHGTIGLQSRAIPAVGYIKDLIASGTIGEVLSTSMIGSGIIYGSMTEQAMAYAMDVRNGAGMIYATFGHALDMLCYVLGEFNQVGALAVNRRKSTTILETGEEIPMTAPDQIAVTGMLKTGAVASLHYRGGMFKGTNFFWEINGTEGDIIFTAPIGHPAVLEGTLLVGTKESQTMEKFEIPAKYTLVSLSPASGPSFAVAQNYALLARDIAEGTHLSPDFEDAVQRHKLIRAIENSAASGERREL